jgi:hypothetical protein
MQTSVSAPGRHWGSDVTGLVERREIGRRAIAADATRRASGVRSTRTAMQCDPLMPFEAWIELGAKLGMHANASCWWLGDWIVFGRAKYGRRYKEAIAVSGLDYQTLRNYAVVARRFAFPRRRADLTFQHHATVCGLPDDEQDAWLERAAAGGWSRNELRRRVRASDGLPASASEILRLAVSQGHAERWRRAAELNRRRLDAWIVDVLDDAATASIDRPPQDGEHPAAELPG